MIKIRILTNRSWSSGLRVFSLLAYIIARAWTYMLSLTFALELLEETHTERWYKI